ncbi:GNAT family N-acetyltransferase [Microbacterium sp. G2-8]|uniref:GNAT family N-acetyltransferase n=1 Tax=Microbacterium sp. G2-8 TaxID=2842454 RepID=UPI001C89360D|nr:GNAT family N-acetyltransferase [Microbacterium sp. G2-8]
MIDIVRGDQLGPAGRRMIVDVLVRGFSEDFSFFSKDPGRLADAFEHMVIPERFFVALVEGEAAAIASVTVGEEECFDPDPRTIRRLLGPVRGVISALVVRSQFLGAHPDARPGLVEIGFVTTAPRFQGRGVATALVRHLIALPGEEFVLREIKNTNAVALGLYEKLGFKVSETRRVRFAKRAGFSEYVSMSLRPGDVRRVTDVT